MHAAVHQGVELSAWKNLAGLVQKAPEESTLNAQELFAEDRHQKSLNVYDLLQSFILLILFYPEPT